MQTIRTLKPAALALLATALCAPLHAVYSNGPNPASGQNSALWGELQPVNPGTLPAARDHSDFDDLSQPWADQHLFRDLHIEGNTIFVCGNAGFEVWDRTNPAAPTRLSFIKSVNFPIPTTFGHNGFICTREVSSPPGNNNVAVLACDFDSAGVVIFNTTNKSNPFVIYQDTKANPTSSNYKLATAVYCARINGVDYAFAAVSGASNSTAGINVYNLNAALALGGTVTECAPAGSGVHIYNGMKPAAGWVPVSVHGVDNFVVTGGIGGWEMFNVNNPAAPTRLGGDITATGYETTMWKEGSSYYLAVLRGPRGGTSPSSAAKELHIYDVTSMAAGTSSTVGAPLAIFSLSPYSATAATEGRLSFSRAGSGTPMLCLSAGPVSVGTSQAALGEKHQSVMDVTDPANPREVTPAGMFGIRSFWGSMWEFGWVRNQTAYFSGNYLYCASFGIMDIYEWNASQANQPPVVTGTPPTTAIVGQPYSYTINASDPEGDPISFNATQKPAGMTVGVSSGVVAWTPGSGDVGSHVIKVEVSDGQTTTLHQWTISVTAGGGGPGNLAPTISSTPPATATVGVAYSYTVIASDPEGGTLAFVKAFGPANLSVNGVTGQVSWTPATGDGGAHSVVVNVTDGVNTVPHGWTITVSGGTGPGPTPGPGTGIGGSGGGGGGGCTAASSGLLYPFVLLGGLLALARRRKARA